MKNSSNQSTKQYESADVGNPSRDEELMQKTVGLNQDLSKEHYRKLFWELARRLAIANTGEILLVEDDYALWLQGYENSFIYDEEETECKPFYETYGYNSQEYADCVSEVNNAIMQHQARLLAQDLQMKYEALTQQAAEMGLPSNLHFLYQGNNPGPSCQTWIIGADGLPRGRDYIVGDSEGQEFHEGWLQLLPGEVIATWEKPCLSGLHYFKLEMYLDAASVPRGLGCITEKVPSSSLVHLTIDSCMPPLSDNQQKALKNFLSMALLECLGDLQANIASDYRSVVNPIDGSPSPDIAGGWLRLLGIEQTYVIEEPDDEDTEEDLDE